MIRITPEMSRDEQDAAYRHNLGVLMFADRARLDDLAMLIQRRNTERNRIRSRPMSVTDRLCLALPAIRGRINIGWGHPADPAVGYFAPLHAPVRSAPSGAQSPMTYGAGRWG